MDFFMPKKKTVKTIEHSDIIENTVSAISEQLNSSSANGENIYLIYQYFTPKIKQRIDEMQYCMKKNLQNTSFKKIFLLNERKYTREELGLTQYTHDIIDARVEQVVLGSRLKFKDVYDFVEKKKLMGFVVVINSDIFFDDTIKILNKTDLHLHKSMIGLLRYEYRKYMVDLSDARLFGPRGDSQDSWIFHTDYNVEKNYRGGFDIYFGQPGCDNKLLYLYKTLGYKIYNDPLTIKSYHLHAETGRNYDLKLIHLPYMITMPYNPKGYGNGLDNSFAPDLRFNMSKDSDALNNYLKEAIMKNERFIIPRIAGIENNVAHLGHMFNKNNGPLNTSATTYLKGAVKTMKNNAGINLTNMNSIVNYANLYLKAFDDCNCYTDWEPYGNVYRGIKGSHDFISHSYAQSKRPIWARTLDVFEYIHSEPWTQCLSGKRILIISSFAKTIEKNMHNADKIYGKDLFPGCDFVYLKPPQTNGKNDSRDFSVELKEFCDKIDDIKDTFDIALVSCGGYGNLVCSHIYDIGKSSIYVGGVLQMYFGILGTRWKRERPDILKFYMNEHWHVPTAEDRPKGFENIEGSCYW